MSNLDREIVWIGHDNEIKIILKSCGSAVDLSGTTKISLNLNDQTLISKNNTASSMSWNQAGYDTGQVNIHIGHITTLVPGIYDASLVVYDSASTEGIVWGDTLPLLVKAEIEK